jgi:hypothetical protein
MAVGQRCFSNMNSGILMNKIKTLNVFKSVAAAILPGQRREPSVDSQADFPADTRQAGMTASAAPVAELLPAKETPPPAPARHYRVVTVERTSAPDGGSGSDWYRYVLEVPGSTLTGTRCGTRQEVTRFATDYVENLSTRNKPYARPAAGAARKKK